MTQTSGWSSTPSGNAQDSSAQEKATQVAQAAKDSGTEVAQAAAEQAKTVTAEAGNQARDLVQEARGQLREQAGAQQQNAVTGLRALVEELQAMAHNSGQSGPASQVADQLADRSRQAADWLEQREPGELLEEFRRLGRRRPGAFLAGAALAGVLAGRLTRGVTAASSDISQQQEHRPLPHPTPDPGYAAQPSGYAATEPSGYAAGGVPPQPTPYPPGVGTAPIYGAPTTTVPPEQGGWR